MADIFLSYTHDDAERASIIAQGLKREGLQVWWDPQLRSGETFDDVIQAELNKASVVVVLWSRASSRSKWVRAEAKFGEGRNALVPVMLEDCEIPIAFSLIQAADLRNWSGDVTNSGWQAFVKDIRDRLHARRDQEITGTYRRDNLQIETLFWTSIKDHPEPADLEAYLRRYPRGQFADLARNWLESPRTRGPPPTTGSPPAPTPDRRTSSTGRLAGCAMVGCTGVLLTAGLSAAVLVALYFFPSPPPTVTHPDKPSALTSHPPTPTPRTKDAEPKPSDPTVVAGPEKPKTKPQLKTEAKTQAKAEVVTPPVPPPAPPQPAVDPLVSATTTPMKLPPPPPPPPPPPKKTVTLAVSDGPGWGVQLVDACENTFTSKKAATFTGVCVGPATVEVNLVARPLTVEETHRRLVCLQANDCALKK